VKSILGEISPDVYTCLKKGLQSDFGTFFINRRYGGPFSGSALFNALQRSLGKKNVKCYNDENRSE